MSAKQQVITIDDISQENVPAIYVAGGLKQFLEHAKAQATGEVPDLTTRKGRERIASLAAQVSKSKTAVEKPGREYLKRLKEMPKVIEAELREFVTSMDALRDEARQPLTDWEKAEDARVDAHNDGIQRIKDLAVFAEPPAAAHVAQVIADLELVALDDSWQEFLPEAAQAKDQALASLRGQLAQRQAYEAEQAELARLRREADERAEQDRIRLAQEAAVEAERQRVAQEQQAERDAAAKREQELKGQAAAREREAENQRLQLQLQAEQAERMAAQAEADRLAAIQAAEIARIEAEKNAERAADQARLDEQRRQKEAADEILRQERLREADKAHKGAIYKAAKEAFMANGMSEDCARLAVKLVASGFIPAMSIQY
ncbi:hypothetical protein RAM80_07690 [Pseudomonas sp. App30]|uniref:hypothetical protein n=1 Tax=Pseudomonas sp. App30 TaxID=3068990 RepID=UPI003A7F7056